jgi:hypothetical protein
VADNFPGRNRPGPERVEAWDWRQSERIYGFSSSEDQAHVPQPQAITFDLDLHWSRGGYRPSLFAETDEASAAYLDTLIATELIVLPAATVSGIPIVQYDFLRALARHNGCELETFRRRLQWDSGSFYHLVEDLCEKELIFRLPCRPLSDRSDLFYFCDTGVLHRLFNPKWSLTGQGAKNFAKSWEGFVVRTIWRTFGDTADVCAWRQNDRDEIDLVVRLPESGDCWAIEIGIGNDKRPASGFWVGVRALGATHLRVIHRGLVDRSGQCERVTLSQFLTDRLEGL